MILIRFQSDATRDALAALTRVAQRPRAIMQAAARAGRRELQRHFRERNRQPNRLGGKRTHFWLDILKSTQLGPITDFQGVILVGDPRFALKVFGGTVRPKAKEALTIPVSPDAHGVRARDESGGSPFARKTGRELFLVKQRDSAFLASALGQGLQVEYILARQAHHDPEPNALPPQDEFERAVVAAAEAQLTEERRKAGL